MGPYMELTEREIALKVDRVSRAITKRRKREPTAEDIVFFAGRKGFRICSTYVYESVGDWNVCFGPDRSTYLYKASKGNWNVCLGPDSNPHTSFEDAERDARIVWTYNTYKKQVIIGRRSDGEIVAHPGTDGEIVAHPGRGLSYIPVDAWGVS